MFNDVNLLLFIPQIILRTYYVCSFSLGLAEKIQRNVSCNPSPKRTYNLYNHKERQNAHQQTNEQFNEAWI